MKNNPNNSAIKNFEIVAYILCAILFTGLASMKESLNHNFILFSWLACLAIEFFILFKKVLGLRDKYLFPFIFLLPLLFVYDFTAPKSVRIYEFLVSISFGFFILKLFFILDIIGLFILLKKKQPQTKKTSKNFFIRILISLILIIPFFYGFDCIGMGCMVGMTMSAIAITLSYLIFPTRNISLYFRNSIINFYKDIKNCRFNLSKKQLLILVLLLIILIVSFCIL